MKTLLEVLNQQSRPVITVNCVIFGFDGKDIKFYLLEEIFTTTKRNGLYRDL